MECLSCHHQPKSRCIDCHETQNLFIRGEALGEKDPEPDVMAGAVQCAECHAAIARGHSLEGVKKTCVQCHEPRYGTMTEDWQREVLQRLRRMKTALEAFRSQNKGASHGEDKRAEKAAEEAERLLKAVEEDKSKGAHNFQYAQKLISEADQKMLANLK